MMKFLEWLGFFICLASSISNGIIRSYTLSDTFWSKVTFVGMFIGGIIAFIPFLYRKLGNKAKSKNL